MALVKCPDCGTEVSAAAPTCPKCGRPIARKAMSAGNCLAGGCLLTLVGGFLFVGTCATRTIERVTNTQTSTGAGSAPPVAAPVAAPTVLRVESWRWGSANSESYVKVDGEITNISNEPVDGVFVKVSFHTKDGTLITSTTGMIEYRPLMPGQSSPFSAMEKHNPLMKSARLNFTTVLGRPIPWEERPAPAPSKSNRPKKNTKDRQEQVDNLMISLSGTSGASPEGRLHACTVLLQLGDAASAYNGNIKVVAESDADAAVRECASKLLKQVLPKG